jgi:hypothetical protein
LKVTQSILFADSKVYSPGLSIEEAAKLASMEVSEWHAVEDGHVPQDCNWLRTMAAALEIRHDQIATMPIVCREAWEL